MQLVDCCWHPVEHLQPYVFRLRTSSFVHLNQPDEMLSDLHQAACQGPCARPSVSHKARCICLMRIYDEWDVWSYGVQGLGNVLDST